MQEIQKPQWLSESLSNAWEQVKEAVRRDWAQTKHELGHGHGGHELNQTIEDTVAQAAGQERIPPIDVANPAKVIGTWTDLEGPIGFGYMARTFYGPRFPEWNDDLEKLLAEDWARGTRTWEDVKAYVHHGYDVRQPEADDDVPTLRTVH